MKKQKRNYKKTGPDGIRQCIRKPEQGFAVLFSAIRDQAIQDEKTGVRFYDRGKWRVRSDPAWSLFSSTFSRNKQTRIAAETIFGEQVFEKDFL